MNTNNAYTVMFMLLSFYSTQIWAMEAGSSSASSSAMAADKSQKKNLIPLSISKPRNAIGTDFIQEFLDLKDTDVILIDTFAELLEGKKKKNEEYILARIITQTDDGAVVHYFDAHVLNKNLFGGYLGKLKTLGEYKHPILGSPLQWLEYYTCAPDKKEFTFMCPFAALSSSDTKKKEFWHARFYANQEENAKVAAHAKCNVATAFYKEADYVQARRLYEQVAQQKDNLEPAAIAKYNLGVIYNFGQGVDKDLMKARGLFQEVAQQKEDARLAAEAQKMLSKLGGAGSANPK